MKTIDEIRRDNLLIAIKRMRTASALADAADVSSAYLSQIKTRAKESSTGKPKGMGDDVARKIEAALGEREGWMDQDHSDELSDLLTNAHPHEIQGGEHSIKRQITGKIGSTTAVGGGKVDKPNTEPGPDIAGKYPLISWVQAGAWEAIVDNFAPGDAEEWLGAPVNVSQSSYYLRVRGESMYDPIDPKSFRDGELALIDPNAVALSGSLVVVRLDDESEATFKQLIIEGDRKYLKALNPNWPNRIFEVNGNATICGVVKGKFVGGY